MMDSNSNCSLPMERVKGRCNSDDDDCDDDDGGGGGGEEEVEKKKGR